MKFRTEKDSLGEVKVPAKALWGAQTQRAVNNFPISGIKMDFPFTKSFVSSLGLIKDAAARANLRLKLISTKKSKAISRAAKEVWKEKHHKEFPIDVFQTGSGTSSNMNANEVIANLASRYSKLDINPNDDVNMSQSSNDVIPTAIKLSAIMDLDGKLFPALDELIDSIEKKAKSLEGVIKTGRTHLMDAMPIDFSEELGAWASQLSASKEMLRTIEKRFFELPQGGTAVGSGINAHKNFSKYFAQELSKLCNSKKRFSPSKNFYHELSAQDCSVQLSGELKNLAIVLMKISNDLRWMNSGPLAGMSEIELKALQPGSSIMPGKVNPVIPEAVAMASADVIGNDVSITVAAQSGSFQLNVMLPVIAYNLLKSINLIAGSMKALSKNAIKTFKVNEKNLESSLSKNPILVTALNPIIGYEKAAEIAKKAYKENRPIIEVAAQETDLSKAKLLKLLDPKKLAKGGI
ncbi:MAG: fumarate hydratase class II 1 [SAR86 cluster bacterium SAR86A]|jgi:fumarate hydratase class II|uniref:Fumarate hydratase class II n=1 Tax=SAR86 cluster bacterium SAR86A TaxID=1123866 RepID=J5KH30_9GAMM|nr:MAG: fumarate hydratase class II 1 [SAR86 cluster bacterium SAR86A]MAN84818.1 class II fumarate hydratase [Gammaproteobacteria bacterium]GIS26290.1 MAG: fumarate hydratase class II [Gammaproteobacteria bacterium]|tara:strand:- start:610 stop:2001 length:1392 start_codon:yes stop_codon:yes gene_type:complete